MHRNRLFGTATAGLALVVGLARPLAAAACPPCGDVNCDGAVDLVDALMIAQVSVGMRATLPCAPAAEVNDTPGPDIADALGIAQFAVGRRGAPVCAPAVSTTAPAVAGAEGGASVDVLGGNFVAGCSVVLDGAPAPATYVDCGKLTVTPPPHRPGPVRVAVVNPDGRSGSPGILTLEGAFRDVTTRAQIAVVPGRGADLLPIAGGVAVGDYDGDGWPDIFVPNHAGPNALLHNRRDGTFEDVASQAGVADPTGRGDGACFGDYDNDGDLDLYVTNHGPNRLYRNNGNGTFTEVTGVAGVADNERGTGCSWGDFDHDGWLDLYVANHLDESDRTVFVTRQFATARRSDQLFHNLRNGTFERVTALLGDPALVTGAGFGASFVDYDRDGDVDLYLVNDFGGEIQPNVLWRNDGPLPHSWAFTNVSATSGAGAALFGMGLAVGDYDGDGFFDFYVTSIGRNLLLHGRGDGTFEDRTDQAGVGRALIGGKSQVGWGDAFFDYDNDGFEDLYVVAGYLDSDPLVNVTAQPNALFHNQGDGTFADVSAVSGADDAGIGRGVAVGDFNRDGFLDLVLVNLGQGVVLLENTARAPGHWLEVTTVGTASNRSGIGARLTAQVGSRRLVRQVIAGSSHMSQHSLDTHFGLGPALTVDRLEILWPSGTLQTLQNVAVNQRLLVTEP